MTHKCVSKLTIIGSDNGLSPCRRQAIIWTNAGILLIGPLGTNFSEILIEIYTFSFKKIHLKVSSGKWRPSCLGLNVLKPWWPSCFTVTYVCQQPRKNYIMMGLFDSHGDGMTWKPLSDYWPFYGGNSPVVSCHKKPVMFLMFSLLLVWTGCWTNSQVASDLRHHDTPVMLLSWVRRRSFSGSKTLMIHASIQFPCTWQQCRGNRGI